MLLVGQAPSRDSDPTRAFSGRSGARLVRLSGLSAEDFWTRVAAINLLDHWPGKRGPKGDHFRLVDARLAAVRIMYAFDSAGDSFNYYVLCGRNVAAAYGLDHLDWFVPYGVPPFVVIPHPSGANHVWNDHAIIQKALDFFREALPR